MARSILALVFLLVLVTAATAGRGNYPWHLVPIDEPGMERLAAAIKAEQFRDEKVAVLQHATQAYQFRVAQLVRLVPLFGWREDRIRAVAVVKRSLLDPENALTLLSLFPESSDREEVRRILSE
jgi:hypothetical protein